ncbi:MAG: hypothetical protein JEZ09_14725 [Salinivirgaceae bacterium]|nr:hypothetical protein [Salinivirgaceae bacterium]
MKKLFYLLFLFFISFSSCDLFEDSLENENSSIKEDNQTRSNWAAKWFVTTKKSCQVDITNKDFPLPATQVINSKYDINNHGDATLSNNQVLFNRSQKLEPVPYTLAEGSRTKGSKNGPNLEFYKREDWSDKIVIKNHDNGSYDNCYNDSEYNAGETLYYYFSFKNSGDASIPDAFKIDVYLDAVFVHDLTFDSWVIEPNGGVNWGWNIPYLTAGNHTISIILDGDNEITESNEGDNEYSRSFFVNGESSGINLIPYKPEGWGDNIVVKNTYTEGEPISLYDDPIYTTDSKLYLAVSYANAGTETINRAIKTALYIDGVEVRVIDYGEGNPFLAGHYRTHWNYAVNDIVLTAGTHTVKMKIDYDNQIAESNESDNEYSRTFTVIDLGGSDLANLQFYKKEDWSDKIVIKNHDNGSYDNCYDDSEFAAGESLYYYFSFKNSGTVSTPDSFYIDVYLDNEFVHDLNFNFWNIEPGHNSAWAWSIPNLTAGNHTLTIKLDSKNDVNESNENDNEYSRTFTVAGPLMDYESFEFVESRYFITKSDGSFLTGELSVNNSVLMLYGLGSISIQTIDNQNIIFKLTPNNSSTAITIIAYKAPEINSTSMTDILTWDSWVLTNSSHTTPDIGGIWTFTKSNSYIFEYSNGTTYMKGWDYADEASIYYGNYGGPYSGVAFIEEISSNYLYITDDVGYWYSFER